MVNNGLKRLRERLYKNKDSGRLESRLERDEPLVSSKDAETYWSKPAETKKDLSQELNSMAKKKKFPIFWFLVFVFVLILFAGVGFYLLNEGIFPWGNVVSSKKIDVEIEGPAAVNSGELNNWYIRIVNRNDAGLELADIIIDYPDGSVSPEGDVVDKQRISSGKISPGGEVTKEISFFMTGSEKEQKDIIVTLEYRLADSNAIFAKTNKKTVELLSSPVHIMLDFPSEIESGREMSMKIEYSSNSEVILSDLSIKAEYPPGFQFVSSSVEPSAGQSAWDVGDLPPQEKREIEIVGILEGQDLTELNFHISAGYKEEDRLVVLASEIASVLLRRPFINLSVFINGADVDVVSGDKLINVTLPWKNNLPTEVRNAVIRMKLVGDVIDFRTVSSSGGFFRSSDNSIIWNSSSLPQLGFVSPGEGGQVSFSFSLKDILPVQSLGDKNFTFGMEGEIIASRISDEGENVEVKSLTKKEIKVSSNMQLGSRLLYSSGPFSNHGPLPPEVGKQTTYTVIWSISNFYNDISSVTVRSSLPSYAVWLGNVSPSNEDITFNSSTGEVVWKPGIVEAGTGILRPVKEAAFQVAISPALNQIGSSPLLLTQTFIEAKDMFTGVTLNDTRDPLNTASISEAQSQSKFGRVIE